MIRTFVSLVAVLSLMSTQPLAAAAGQRAVGAAAAAKPAITGVININTASAAELDALPGIGVKTAERIVAYRQKNGPFKKVEELMNVRGVGEKNFLKLKGQLTVTAAKPDRKPQER